LIVQLLDSTIVRFRERDPVKGRIDAIPASPALHAAKCWSGGAMPPWHKVPAPKRRRRAEQRTGQSSDRLALSDLLSNRDQSYYEYTC
jgi:hypothetical protein